MKAPTEILSARDAEEFGVNRWEAPSVGYVSEHDALWTKLLSTVAELSELKALGSGWAKLCSDANEKIQKMAAGDFDDFQAALKKERRGEFCGEEASERFAAIIMPALLVRVSMTADQFKVPWGLAFIRLQEVGRVAEHRGVFVWKEKTA